MILANATVPDVCFALIILYSLYYLVHSLTVEDTLI